ncbi:hypothetical protein FisN_7Lh068 [Fistulifera solaris]|uniref:Uncharacterized protein n=1 Tax=Fistulifera solaris TaxID=1519565 RepID=A0A1Z5JD49_FISSO|nr:hypothetical protein FisN_7Lh068 [Fistulifera solaris]|eukprot:GAX11698.1 hypothetical protein FisN_7Lh068 [Fistulifera solaris]
MVTPIKVSRRDNSDIVEKSPEQTGTNPSQRRFLPPFRKKSNNFKSPNAITADFDVTLVPETPQLINITIGDDVEVLTPESKEQMDERIRRNLFPEEVTADDLSEPFGRLATSMSVEVTPDGKYLESPDAVEGTGMSPESFRVPDSPSADKRPEDLLTYRKATYKGPVSVDSPDNSENGSVYSTPPLPDSGVKITLSSTDSLVEEQPAIVHDVPDTPVLGNTMSVDESKDAAAIDDTIMIDDDQSKKPEGDSSSVRDNVARQLFGTFCADDVNFGAQSQFRETFREISLSKNPVRRLIDLFYDNACTSANPAESDRPYFDEDFTLRFIRRMTTKGVALLYLQAPGAAGNGTSDWKGRTVAMHVKKGSPYLNEHESEQPRISWTTVVGGQTHDALTTSIDLFDIVSIKSSSRDELLTNQDLVEEREDFCFFTITVSNGQVYIFESNTLDERDSLVNGLKNVISRLAFQVTVGDVSALKELYLEEDILASNAALTGDLPILPNPMQAINRIAHVMLD